MIFCNYYIHRKFQIYSLNIFKYFNWIFTKFSPNFQIDFTKFEYIFTEIFKYISPNFQIYFTEFSNIFHRILKYISPNFKIYLLKLWKICFIQLQKYVSYNYKNVFHTELATWRGWITITKICPGILHDCKIVFIPSPRSGGVDSQLQSSFHAITQT